ncbi:unnamed protein product [Penicillium glandicola]
MPLSQAQPHSFLRSLFQQLNDLEADFPSLETLQTLGMQAFQVSMDTEKNGTLKLNPCFFEPRPEKGLLQMYPLEPGYVEWDQRESMELSPLPSVQDIMDRAVKKYPPEVAPTLENLRKDDRFDFDMAHDPESLATELDGLVDIHLDAIRLQGPYEDFRLADLKTQRDWDLLPKEDDPPSIQDSPRSKMWELVSYYRYSWADHPRKPHSVLSCLSIVCPTETYPGISTHELCAIVCAMLLRVNHKPFSACHIHPVLVLSYMGNRRARIIQALYDGQTLVLQYSPLWNFAEAETASIEIFVRYRLSEPVGFNTHTLSIR